MLPLRTIFESLGAEVKWDEATKTVTASKAGKEIDLQIGSYIAAINRNEVMLERSPRMVNGTTMVPVRFVSESFGAKVTWDNEHRAVLITL